MMDIKVEMYRPERRFGWAVLIHRRALDGSHEVMHFSSTGEPEWTTSPKDLTTLQQPSLMLDDEVVTRLAEKFQKAVPPPPPTPSDDVRAHLAREIEHHDKAVWMLEDVIKVLITPRMVIPGDSP